MYWYRNPANDLYQILNFEDKDSYAKRLLTRPGQQSEPFFSNSGLLVFHELRNSKSTIRTIDTKGRVRTIAPSKNNWPYYHALLWPTFTADGQSVVYAERLGDLPTAKTRTWQQPLKGKRKQLLPYDAQVRFNCDGSYLVECRRGYLTIRPLPRGPNKVSVPLSRCANPVFHPTDPHTLMFWGGNDFKTAGLYTVRVDGTQLTQVLAEPTAFESAYTSTGDIVYSALDWETQEFNLYLFNPNRASKKELTSFDNASARQPIVHGSRLVFVMAPSKIVWTYSIYDPLKVKFWRKGHPKSKPAF